MEVDEDARGSRAASSATRRPANRCRRTAGRRPGRSTPAGSPPAPALLAEEVEGLGLSAPRSWIVSSGCAEVDRPAARHLDAAADLALDLRRGDREALVGAARRDPERRRSLRTEVLRGSPSAMASKSSGARPARAKFATPNTRDTRSRTVVPIRRGPSTISIRPISATHFVHAGAARRGAQVVHEPGDEPRPVLPLQRDFLVVEDEGLHRGSSQDSRPIRCRFDGSTGSGVRSVRVRRFDRFERSPQDSNRRTEPSNLRTLEPEPRPSNPRTVEPSVIVFQNLFGGSVSTDHRTLDRPRQARVDPVAGEIQAAEGRAGAGACAVDQGRARTSRAFRGRQSRGAAPRRAPAATRRPSLQPRRRSTSRRLARPARRRRSTRATGVSPFTGLRMRRGVHVEDDRLVEDPLRGAAGQADERLVHHRRGRTTGYGDDRLRAHRRGRARRSVPAPAPSSAGDERTERRTTAPRR